MVDDHTGKRIDVLAWSFMEDLLENNPLVEKVMEDGDIEEAEMIRLTQTQRPNNNKEEELKVGDEIVVVGKFVKSK